VRGWARIRTTASHPPLTWELTVLFAVTLSSCGLCGPGVAMLLSFHCYLRVGELTRMRTADVVQPSDARVGSVYQGMALRLPKTKTGLNQWVSIDSTEIGIILQLWMRVRAAQRSTAPRSSLLRSDLIFPFSPSYFRRCLSRAKSALGLDATPYVPHSLRHGGATHDTLRGASIEQVMFRGRWQQMQSARRYIQTGRAMLVAQQVPLAVHQRGLLFAQHLEAAMSRCIVRFHTDATFS
jgi:integrase